MRESNSVFDEVFIAIFNEIFFAIEQLPSDSQMDFPLGDPITNCYRMGNNPFCDFMISYLRIGMTFGEVTDLSLLWKN